MKQLILLTLLLTLSFSTALHWNEHWLHPWQEMRKMQQDMERFWSSVDRKTNLLEGGPGNSLVMNEPRELANWRPVVDVKTNDKDIVVHAELPGVKKDDISIDLEV